MCWNSNNPQKKIVTKKRIALCIIAIANAFILWHILILLNAVAINYNIPISKQGVVVPVPAVVDTRTSTWWYWEQHRSGSRNNYTNYTWVALANNGTLFDSLFNNSLYPATSTIPWANVSTSSYYYGGFYSGYRNQMMAFTAIVLLAIQEGHSQFLVETLRMKDTYGSNNHIEFYELWDLEHWNSYYPRLPIRLVRYDPILFDNYDVNQRGFYRTAMGNWTNRDHSKMYDEPIHPHCSGGKQHWMFGEYTRYARGKPTRLGNDTTTTSGRHPAEILMLQGALRPHKDIQQIIDQKLHTLVGDDDNNDTVVEYMTLHARIEPDMQKHPVCRDKKVKNLTQILEFIQTQWPTPPVPRIFLPINRALLEDHVTNMRNAANNNQTTTKEEDDERKITMENLQTLNQARDFGLWNGTVKTFEFGSHHLIGTRYEHRRSTTGALLNFFVAIDAKIFVGTEVSSYSHDLVATRFFRNQMENYNYLPDGLHHWTPPGTPNPPGFGC